MVKVDEYCMHGWRLRLRHSRTEPIIERISGPTVNRLPCHLSRDISISTCKEQDAYLAQWPQRPTQLFAVVEQIADVNHRISEEMCVRVVRARRAMDTVETQRSESEAHRK